MRINVNIELNGKEDVDECIRLVQILYDQGCKEIEEKIIEEIFEASQRMPIPKLVESPPQNDLENADWKNLTPRQREVLKLLKQGKVSKEIADILNISVSTVSLHRSRIRAKRRGLL